MIRKLLLFLILVIGTPNLIAQKFGDNNPVWNYGSYSGFTGDIGHSKLTVKKDTIFNGKKCVLLNKGGHFGCAFLPYLSMVCTDSLKVLFWSASIQEFQVLYDFGANKNDAWEITFDDVWGAKSKIYCKIDSVYTENINGRSLKAQKIRINYQDSIFLDVHRDRVYTVIEQVGCTRFLFPWIIDYGVCDDGGISSLRCFENDSIGFYQFDTSQVCQYSEVGTDERLSDKNDWQIFPNPSKGKFQVIVPAKEDKMVLSILNMQGTEVYFQEINNASGLVHNIDFSLQPSGVYLMEIQDQNGKNVRKKLVLQR